MTSRAMPDAPSVAFSLLDEQGDVRAAELAPRIGEEQALRLYRCLLQVRIVDERMMKLQRQGRLGFYIQSTGEEATHLAVAALRSSDWVFPSYREPGAAFYRGVTLKDFVNQLFGNAADPVKGRQMPVHHSARRVNLVSISSPVGTQIPQAAGMAWAARLAGRDDVALTYFGEGTTSTGEFHVGLNLAGVARAPCIFFCRNNSWAISTPETVQTRSSSFAAKAFAYGLPAVRVDGNDVLAILAVMEDAVARARAGEGATLIEAETYRRAAHSSSDDPSIYRATEVGREWEARDPIERWRRFLARRGWWSEALEERWRGEIVAELAQALDEAERLGPPPRASLFEDVYGEMPKILEEQRRELRSAKEEA